MKVFIIIAGIALVIYLGMWLGQKLSSYRVIGCDTPVVVMFVGDTYELSAYLLDKPSGSTDFQCVGGSIEFFQSGTCFILFGNPSMGLNNVPTSPLNSDNFLVAEPEFSSVIGSKQKVVGISPGEGEVQISGDASGGEVHSEIAVPVYVFANDGSKTLLDLFRIASEKAGDVWYNTAFGNFMVNFFGGENKGLCDHWADWTARWFMQLNNGEICKIEKVWFGQNNWWRPDHVCVRITMCETGEVFYVDGHQDPESPIFGKDAYEDQLRRGSPTRSETWYER